MPEITYRGRRAFQIASPQVEVTVLAEGGHIASILHKPSATNPLWTPPWPSMEPSMFDRAKTTAYGHDAESKLLAGIMGHNLCLDVFGGPGKEEEAAGVTVHGEASVARYSITGGAGSLHMHAELKQPGLLLDRHIEMRGDVVAVTETVENLSSTDRPIAWTQHVTLGPPFLERGKTQFRAPGTRSKVIEFDFTEGKGLQKTGADFDWPHCPRKDGGSIDLRVYPAAEVSAGYTTHLMDPHREQAFFVAWSPAARLLFGYVWNRSDFPWLGRWEENHSRTNPPWNGNTMTCGMEFGASPMPETRRSMIERGSLFGVPGYRWLTARSKATVQYCAFARAATAIPQNVVWDGGGSITYA
ncbi:MAG: hypothetical protein JJE04_02420 [Acidobacteriia bacterium]|nr:hypothetical protein [Terriglobia bacterium]